MLTAEQIKRLLDIANAGVNAGEIVLARQVYEGVLAGSPGHAPALISLALSHIAVGEYDEAEDILQQRVLAANPEDWDALCYLGLSLVARGRKDEGAEALRKIPQDAAAYALAQELLNQ
ncbi:MAG: tetratricopeptide repeat protein [Duodenibacillus sp.]|nr:tetratricopeptide repeat protein [Duodenibacillus sp.]